MQSCLWFAVCFHSHLQSLMKLSKCLTVHHYMPYVRLTIHHYMPYSMCKYKNSSFMMKKEDGPLHFARNFQHILCQIYFFWYGLNTLSSKYNWTWHLWFQQVHRRKVKYLLLAFLRKNGKVSGIMELCYISAKRKLPKIESIPCSVLLNLLTSCPGDCI